MYVGLLLMNKSVLLLIMPAALFQQGVLYVGVAVLLVGCVL